MTERNIQTRESQKSGARQRPKNIFNRMVQFSIRATLFGILFGVIAVIGLYLYIAPTLPSIESLKDVRFQVPLRVYSADGLLMGEFGEKRRIPLRYEEYPEHLIHAFLGAEDDRFFEHPGVDYQGLLRAVAIFASTGEKAQGGSTITMQVARNFFLSNEKTFFRKFSEIILSFQIEQALSKEEIFSLYLNKIYLGNRAYGVGAAAQIYYGKTVQELDLAEMAMIAGLPKAPSRYNPVANPTRAMQRRDYVLRRMLDLNYIDKQSHDAAIKRPVTASLYGSSIELDAAYAAEMVRKEMTDRYGEDAYTEGYKVYTTLNGKLQKKADSAIRRGLLNYEERHGYRGPEKQLDLLDYAEPAQWETVMAELNDFPLLIPGVVIQVNNENVYLYLKTGEVVSLCWQGMKWAAPYIDGSRVGNAPTKPSDVLKQGDVIRVYNIDKKGWNLGQVPEVSGALVSLNPNNGAIQSIVGGYDFYQSKFNRAIQAKRQPGSNFKPFVYSAALEKGYTAATLINDAPVVFNDPGLEESWRPENYNGEFSGPTRFREALVNSRNLVSIRILRSIGINYAVSYAERFGFKSDELPKNLSLALGSAAVTPMEVARGYAVFANGGYFVDTYLIEKIIGPNDELLFQANPPTVCHTCKQAGPEEGALKLVGGNLPLVDVSQPDSPDSSGSTINLAKRVIDEKNVFIMTSIMRDIIDRGTGRRARSLKRSDLAGKTGTTNDQRDAWFSGFNSDIATTVWIGYDKPQPLGENESGAKAALPIWIEYMREALAGVPEAPLVQPAGIVTVRIDPETGLLANADAPTAIFESFKQDSVPNQMAEAKSPQSGGIKSDADAPEQLF